MSEAEITCFIVRLCALASTGRPAIAPAWWGGLPEFSPNPDKVQA